MEEKGEEEYDDDQEKASKGEENKEKDIEEETGVHIIIIGIEIKRL